MIVSRRRLLVTTAALLVPIRVAAQPARKVTRIGLLWTSSPSPVGGLRDALRQGLRELGYVEGTNIRFDERSAEDRLDRLPALAADLVKIPVDVIVTQGTPPVQAAMAASRRSEERRVGKECRL